ncbi:MAG TPA: VWA domain-containing protein [Actinomycetota bacterium]|nr:VWA domain-containing protein [Actinomycetota bacterium]
MLEFEHALRGAGVPVSVGEGLDALRALGHVSFMNRSSFKTALGATMVKGTTYRDTFDTLFDLYFGVVPGSPGGDDDPLEMLDEFLPELSGAIASGDQQLLDELARRAVAAFGRVEDSPSGEWYSLYQVVRTVDLSLVITNLAGSAEEKGEGALAAMLRREELERRGDAFKNQLLRETRRRVARVRGAEAVARYALRPPLEDVPFLSATHEEMAALRRAVQPLARKLAARLSMRRRRERRGALDLRRTMRGSLSTGGVPFEPLYRRRAPHRPELFVLCDVSGSVARFARFGLMLTHALSAQFQRVRSFAFVDRVDEITRLFANEDFVEAVARMQREANVVDLDGHSDYGAALEQFLDRYGNDLSPKTTVLVLGDARTNYRRPKEWALEKVARRARRVLWLNPEPVADWDSGDSDATNYACRIDKMVEVRTLRQLEAFIALEL